MRKQQLTEGDEMMQVLANYTYQSGQAVSFDNGMIKGFGVIKGISTHPQAVIGAGYIIEPNDSPYSAAYPFDLISVMECHITPID